MNSMSSEATAMSQLVQDWLEAERKIRKMNPIKINRCEPRGGHYLKKSMQSILTVNGGSSSIKFALYQPVKL